MHWKWNGLHLPKVGYLDLSVGEMMKLCQIIHFVYSSLKGILANTVSDNSNIGAHNHAGGKKCQICVFYVQIKAEK